MEKLNRQVTVWFPDEKVLQEIKNEAEKTDRGIGYVICKNWKRRSGTTDSSLATIELSNRLNAENKGRSSE